MNRIFTFALLLCAVVPASAQGVLTLDSCRVLALRNNKQLNASRLKQEVATNIRKAARTKYLPKIDAIGGYQYFSRQISLLSGAQQDEISNLGTSMAGAGAQAETHAARKQKRDNGFGFHVLFLPVSLIFAQRAL